MWGVKINDLFIMEVSAQMITYPFQVRELRSQVLAPVVSGSWSMNESWISEYDKIRYSG